MISARFDQFSDAMFGKLTPTGKAWARVGIIMLIVSAIMSFHFGFQISLMHGVFLAGLSFAAAFGPEVSHKLFEEQRHFVGVVVGILAAGLLTIEFGSHNSYVAGIRGDNLAQTKVANVKYDGAQDGVGEAKTSLKLWEDRLAALETANTWSASVTADALRAKLASANLAIEQETARGGCKAKCLAVTKDRDELSSRIAIAEEKVSLTKQIQATKLVIASARDKADNTEHKSSAVAHSNAALAKAVAFITTGSLKPSDQIEVGAEISANLAMAIAGTGLPAFCLFVTGLHRRKDEPDAERHETPVQELKTTAKVVHPYQPAISAPAAANQNASHIDTLKLFHEAYKLRCGNGAQAA